jgi:hypothetical protein
MGAFELEAAAVLGQLHEQTESLRRIRDVLEGRDASYTAGGRVTAPAAGAPVATLRVPPPGKYELTLYVTVGNVSDLGNAQLQVGTKVDLQGLGTPGGGPFTLVRQLDGESDVSVNATLAGGGGVVYVAVIVATKIE